MNPLDALMSRSRVEELARLLDGAVAGPGAVTTGHAGLALRLRSLAPAADGPRALRPEFRLALRTRLLAVAAVTPVGATATAPPARAVSWTQGAAAQRRLGATAGALAGVIAVAGIGIASSRSLPGQPFYGLKRASEGVELSFSSGRVARAGKHLDLARTRLREIAALAHGDGELALAPLGTARPQAAGIQAFGGSLSQRVRSTLADMDRETRQGRQLLEASYRSSGRTAPLTMLTTFTASQSRTLTALLPDLPAGTSVSAEQSLALLRSIADGAIGLMSLGTCTGACDPSAAGPQLPTGPAPASPSGPTTGSLTRVLPGQDTNGVPPCGCVDPGSGPTVSPQRTTGPAPGGVASSVPSPDPLPTRSAFPGRPSDPTAPDVPVPVPGGSLAPVPPPPFPVPTLPVPTLPVPLPTLLVPGLPRPVVSLPPLPGPLAGLASLLPLPPQP